ncbi:transporter [Paracoccus tegillarcae]|uniref:Transporter n=1 Tax=Paracoccus tegillarcae TaxID=1529068 RepID=A0A2K9EIN3_9RHOB|nr:transporter [Paracoccus tegillarcae]AUH34843.1 transporter [Paracoccus tegillarcae]
MSTLWLLLIVVLMTVLGDYLIKLATALPDGLLSRSFVIGSMMYGASAIGWFFLMRKHSLAAVGVLYSSGTLILMAALGVIVFREPIGPREALGVALAMASLLIMSHRS